jgi:hypothetical protein
MLLVYRKDTGKVLHYVDCDGRVQPTLFGLYHACIKKNYPDIKLEDLGEYYSNDSETDENMVTIKQKILKYDTIYVEENGLRFEKNYTSDPIINRTDRQRISDLEIAMAAVLGGAV